MGAWCLHARLPAASFEQELPKQSREKKIFIDSTLHRDQAD